MLKIYNSLTNKLEEFKPIIPGKVSMYICGPTVYNYAHIGNMVPVVIFDMIYRYLKYLEYDVTYVSNFTDVDDKIIAAALENNTTEKEITEKYIEIYLKDVASFNCLDINIRPKVTETIPEIIDFIQLLIDKDFAYEIDGDVYFRVGKLESYGKLSNQNIEALNIGSRIEIDNKKENPYDFALWKKTDKGIKWNAPFGEGRPGWHTECVVMIRKLFNDKIDIHGGGKDLKFPHHENEIAQGNAAYDNDIANYWMHNGSLMINGEKMSKSLNNFILAHELREKHSANAIRIALLKSHYRLPINLTDSLFAESNTIDEKVYNALKQAKVIIDVEKIKIGNIKKDATLEEFMDDDFNTSNVVTYLLDLVKELNSVIRSKEFTNISQIYDRIILINYVLGLNYDLPNLNDEDIENYLNWVKYRDAKNFEKADILRKILVDKKIL